MNKRFVVKEQEELLKFLYENLKDMKQKKVKAFLTDKKVLVDNKIITKYNYILKPKQVITIDENGGKYHLEKNNIELIYEDEEIIVINKPEGLLSIASVEEKEKTAYKILTQYVKLSNVKNRVFIVHRLDKETSGIMLLSKSENLKHKLQDNWDKLVQFRGYISLVEGILKVKEDTIKTMLIEDEKYMVHNTLSKDGQLAITKYKVVAEGENISLLKIELKTGRKNQIRVHMQGIGHPVIGDKKYGSKKNPIKRLGLHAYKLAFIHPITNKKMEFETDIPNSFISIIN